MNQPRASRLNKDVRKGPGFFTGPLPLGSFKRKLVLRLIVPLVIIMLGYTVIDDIVMPILTRAGTEFPLPDFTRQRLLEARISLDDLDLKYEIAAEEYAPGVEKGVILNQFPIANTKVKPGRAIKFVLSLGEKNVAVPEMGGRSVRQAILDLESADLTLGEIAWAFSDTLPEKVVVFSYPAVGTEIPIGTPVNLMVNRGRASNFTYMPKVIGLAISEAMKRLEDKHLTLGLINYRIDENYLPETVLEQSEPEGAELDVGTEVDLVVSTVE